MKKTNLIVLTALLLITFAGCDKKQPIDPAGNSLVSTIEVENVNGTIVEALYSDSTKMYFRLLSDTTAEVVSCHEFYYHENESSGWIYRGKVAVPEKLTHSGKDYTIVGIGNHAFGFFLDYGDYYYPASFVTEVELPNTITRIGDEAFYECEELVSINLSNHLTYIGYAAFANTGLTSVEVPDSITEIMHSCFAGCEHLSAVKLPNTIVIIDDVAFAENPLLTTFEIPASVKCIGSYAFMYCDALKTMFCRPTSPPMGTHLGIYSEGPIQLSDSLETLYVPMESVEAYKNDLNWQHYSDIIVGN